MIVFKLALLACVVAGVTLGDAYTILVAVPYARTVFEQCGYGLVALFFNILIIGFLCVARVLPMAAHSN